ncbi:uncharacterized protein BDV14DRAFT_185075 [Aspergillus stella-maris]|uniref:uncharacterized protein n=1 Tax=Aspergillus stella-maris TaxID=1810926 RepID=UPI003CCE322A
MVAHSSHSGLLLCRPTGDRKLGHPIRDSRNWKESQLGYGKHPDLFSGIGRGRESMIFKIVEKRERDSPLMDTGRSNATQTLHLVTG